MGLVNCKSLKKIYLENTNLMQVLSPTCECWKFKRNIFANQVGYRHKLLYTENGDFLVG
jgi:uncharacterized protein